jgi:hypothetical protein
LEYTAKIISKDSTQEIKFTADTDQAAITHILSEQHGSFIELYDNSRLVCLMGPK